MKYKLILIFILLTGLNSCESMQNRENVGKLDTAIKKYEKALRWAEYRAAASYHVGRDKKPLVVDLENAKNFNVTGINVVEKTINPEINEAIVLAEISYYNKEYGTLKKLRQEQHWWREDDTRNWLIESDFPKFE